MKQNQYQTGDLILYHGEKSCVDKFLECVTPSNYSHVSMVIVIPNPAFEGTDLEDGVYVIESTRSQIPDAEDRLIKIGVQMTKIEDVLAEKGQEIWHRKMVCIRDEKFYKNLKLAHNKVHSLPYNFDLLDRVNAAGFSWFNCLNPCKCLCRRQRVDRFWCSALVSYILVQLELLPFNTPWTDVSPRDLGSEKGRKNVHFVNCTLFPEEKIQ